MIFPALDLTTLFVVSAVVVGSSGCLLVLAGGRDRAALPPVLWGVAMLIGACGIVLLAMAPLYHWPARLVGNAAILTGTGLSWSGARLFAGRHVRPLLICAGPAVWLVFDVWRGEAPGPASMNLAFLIGATYTAATASELARTPDEHLPTRPAAIFLLVLHAVMYVVHAIIGTLAPAAVLTPGFALWLMFEALLHTTWMAMLFLALMKERAEARSTRQLRALATHDELTGLGNRRHFDQTLRQELRRATRSRTALGLLMIDVDHFKAFNDSYGHLAGDDALRRVAAAIQAACARPGDQATRYGGEEFAVLLPRIDEAGVQVVAEAVRSRVARLAIDHAHGVGGIVTVSIGTACLAPRPNAAVNHIVDAADQALYAAKAAGRNTVMPAGNLVAG